VKTIVFNSTKGGCGKSTLSILTINILVKAGYKVLAIDMDTINHSLSYYFSEARSAETYLEKNIFNVFAGQDINDNIISLSPRLSLIPSSVKLSDFRTVEYGRLRRCLKGISEPPDYIIIDTSPTFDNITINTFTVADILVIPAIPEPFNYQAVKYLISKIEELELSNLDINIVLNQYEKPRSENTSTFSNQVVSLFLSDPTMGGFVSSHHLSRSNHIKKYTSSREFLLNFEKQKSEILSIVNSLLNISIEEV